MEAVDLPLDSVEAVDPMAAAGDLRLDSVGALAPMAAVGGRPQSVEAVDLRVAVGAGRMAEAVVAAGATAAVMARAD